jgi:hypothetical protein
MRQLSKLDRLIQKRVPMKRRRYTKEFKAKVALEAIKGQRTANELASEFGVHAGQTHENILICKEQIWPPDICSRQIDLFTTECVNESETPLLAI